MPRYRSARQEKGRSAGQSVGDVAPSALYVAPSRKARGPSLRSGRQKERRDDKKKGTTKRKACLGVIKKRAVGLLCKPKNGDRMSFYVKI
jgi:hypothetical protein